MTFTIVKAFHKRYKTIKVLHRRFLCQSSTIKRIDYHNKPINILSAKRHIVCTELVLQNCQIYSMCCIQL